VIDTSELTVGQSVRVNDGVRPSRFSGKIGIIVENRREEVGIRFAERQATPRLPGSGITRSIRKGRDRSPSRP